MSYRLGISAHHSLSHFDVNKVFAPNIRRTLYRHQTRGTGGLTMLLFESHSFRYLRNRLVTASSFSPRPSKSPALSEVSRDSSPQALKVWRRAYFLAQRWSWGARVLIQRGPQTLCGNAPAPCPFDPPPHIPQVRRQVLLPFVAAAAAAAAAAAT